MKLERYEALRNPETKEERYTFSTQIDNIFVVVKRFDPEQEEDSTFKVFRGMYYRVKSHWRTLIEFKPSEAQWASVQADVELLLRQLSG